MKTGRNVATSQTPTSGSFNENSVFLFSAAQSVLKGATQVLVERVLMTSKRYVIFRACSVISTDSSTVPFTTAIFSSKTAGNCVVGKTTMLLQQNLSRRWNRNLCPDDLLRPHRGAFSGRSHWDTRPTDPSSYRHSRIRNHCKYLFHGWLDSGAVAC